MTHNTQEVAEGPYVETFDDVMQKLHMLCSPAAEVLSDGARVNCFIDLFNQLSQTLQNKKVSEEMHQIRRLVAEMFCSAGCDCCRDTNEWDRTTEELAKLLEIPAYEDGSGFNFYQVRDEYKEKDKLK